MKLIFAGTPDFAAAALSALAAAGHDIPLVLTQPDRPAGRGMKLKPSAVKARALELGLRVEQPLSLRNDEAQAMLRADSAKAEAFLPQLRQAHYQGVTGMIAFDSQGELQNPRVTLFGYGSGERKELLVSGQ